MTNDDNNPRSLQIDAAIAEYLEAMERGAPLDRDTFIAQHADLAKELREFLADYSALKQEAPRPASSNDETTDLSNDRAQKAAHANGNPLDVLRYFGDYELVEEIARGGMGVVYKARQATLQRIVAVKMILAGQLASPAEVDRFYAEAQAAATLDHPNIVPIFEVGQHQGQHYFSMGYVAGESLAQRLAAGPLAPKEAAAIIRVVALAVHYAHGQGVIHRDLKPGNILFDGDGHPRVTDFGLAKRQTEASGLTATGQVLGTPSYMPPEQVSGSNGQIGPTADVYSLGATLYALLIGRPPFQSASAIDTLKQVMEKDPVPLREFDASVPRDLETITLKCLEKSPDRRYSTARELADELDRYLTGRPILARPVGRVEHAWRWCRRNPVVTGLTSAVAISLIVGTVASTFFAVQSSRRAEDNLVLAKKEAAARGDAESQQRRAEKNFELATKNQRAAEENARTTRQHLYAANMKLVQEAWEETNIQVMRDLLERTSPKAGEEDLRGFEWYYWNRMGHQESMTFTGHTQRVDCIAYSPDGKLIASVSDSTIKLWNAVTGQELMTLSSHTDSVNSVAFTPDGKQLASASNDKTIKLWDTATGQPTKTLTGHTDYVLGIAVSPDGKQLASASRDQTVWLWDLESGRETLKFTGHTNWVDSVAFSPDGRHLASSSHDQSIKLWDVLTGKETNTWKCDTFANVVFSPDGKQLASAWTDIQLWDTATGQEITKLSGNDGGVWSVAFSPDGRSLASANQDRTIKLWNVASCREIKTFKGHSNPVYRVTFSPDGRRIASSSWDDTVKQWDLVSEPEELVLNGSDLVVRSIAIGPDGRLFATGSEHGEVRLWDLATGQELIKFDASEKRIASVVFSPDGQRLATVGSDTNVQLWEAHTGRNMMTLACPDYSVCRIAFSPDGKLLASAGNGLNANSITLWDAATGRKVMTLRGGRDVRAISFSPDGKNLASASHDQFITLWDITTGQIAMDIKGPGTIVLSLAFSPDGKCLASAGEDQNIRLWDVATGQETMSIRGYSRFLSGVVFSPDGKRLASFPWGGEIEDDIKIILWDTASGQETATLKGASGCVAFSPDGNRLA